MKNKRNYKNISLEEAFLKNINKNNNGCWDWIGTITHEGYGRFKYNKKMITGQRYSYINYKGPIDKKLVVKHSCINNACVNPEHLYLDKAGRFKPLPLKILFNNRFSKMENDGCWNWIGTIDPDGYGRIRYNKKTNGAHRISWILNYGEIPKGMVILHKCDNRRCVRIDHLYLGTIQDNIKDMDKKNRRYKKITIEKIKEIKKLIIQGLSNREIAKIYYTTKDVICRIKYNRDYFKKYENMELL